MRSINVFCRDKENAIELGLLIHKKIGIKLNMAREPLNFEDNKDKHFFPWDIMYSQDNEGEHAAFQLRHDHMFWQDKMTVPQFYRYIVKRLAYRRWHKERIHTLLTDIYPNTHITIDHLCTHSIGLKLHSRSGSTAYGTQRMNKGLGDFTEAALLSEIMDELMEAYPSLRFGVMYPWVEWHRTNLVSAYVVGSGTHTGWDGQWPLTGPAKAKLKKINTEAEKSLVDTHFYCTCCQKAYPKEEYGFFYFASRYCKQCGDDNPEFRKKAANERYN